MLYGLEIRCPHWNCAFYQNVVSLILLNFVPETFFGLMLFLISFLTSAVVTNGIWIASCSVLSGNSTDVIHFIGLKYLLKMFRKSECFLFIISSPAAIHVSFGTLSRYLHVWDWSEFRFCNIYNDQHRYLIAYLVHYFQRETGRFSNCPCVTDRPSNRDSFPSISVG